MILYIINDKFIKCTYFKYLKGKEENLISNKLINLGSSNEVTDALLSSLLVSLK